MNSKGGPLWNKCFVEDPETHPDILGGGHRNPYQMENATKSGGTVFLIISLGECEWCRWVLIWRLSRLVQFLPNVLSKNNTMSMQGEMPV